MLIGLNGQMGSGKDTIVERVRSLAERHAEKSGSTHVIAVERYAFADKLKDSAAVLLGIDRDDMERWKNDPESVIKIEADFFDNSERSPEPIMVPGFKKSLTFREYLQRYGTEAHRDIFGDNFWVEQTMKGIGDHRIKLVFITDVRFPNEADAVHEANGYVWNVKGPDFNPNPTHPSEQILDEALIDLEIWNKRRDDDFHSLDSTLSHLLTDILDKYAVLSQPEFMPARNRKKPAGVIGQFIPELGV